MNPNTLKKSLLDFAIKGHLTAKWRRESGFGDGVSGDGVDGGGVSGDGVGDFTGCVSGNGDGNFPFAIPNSWQWVRLGEICEITLGKTPPKDNETFWNSADYQWVSIADMIDRQTITHTKKSISQAARNECFGGKICKKGTLIMSFKLTIGRTSFMGFDGFHNEAIAALEPKIHSGVEAEIFKRFLMHFLEFLTAFIETTGAIKGETLNIKKLKNLQIPLPPVAEQEEMVRILDRLVALADEFAAVRVELERIEKRIEKSFLELALSGGLSSDPASWQTHKLGEICEIFTGNSINAAFKEANFINSVGTSYIGTKDISNDCKIDYENGVKIPQNFIKKFKIAPAFTPLLCLEGGSAGRKIGFTKREVCFGNKLCAFAADSRAEPKFLFYFLRSPQFLEQFNAALAGIIGGVSKKNLAKFEIPLPPLKEQRRLVGILDRLFEVSKGLKID